VNTGETIRLELYVVGQSARSMAAIANLERICRSWLDGRYELTIVDVLDHPEAAEAANIVATPTLIRRAPSPVRRLVGDLSPTDVVLRGLGLEDDVRAAPGEDTRDE
jgi:circadian clock protein KaiB